MSLSKKARFALLLFVLLLLAIPAAGRWVRVAPGQSKADGEVVEQAPPLLDAESLANTTWELPGIPATITFHPDGTAVARTTVKIPGYPQEIPATWSVDGARLTVVTEILGEKTVNIVGDHIVMDGKTARRRRGN